MGVSTTNGTGAEILAVSNDIGRVTGVTRTNLGSGYDSVPDVIVQENLILEDIVGTFIAGEPVTSQPYHILKEDEGNILLETGDILESEITAVENGVIQSIDTTRSLYKIKLNTVDDSFEISTNLIEKTNICLRRSRIRGTTSGATAVICQVGTATINPRNGTVSSSEGVLFGADGRLSESSKNIQDSLYYQDFSYVVKVGQSINVWRDAIKRILHPVGLALFGEVSVQTSARASAWGGSNFRLNQDALTGGLIFKPIEFMISLLKEATPVAREQKMELEIFTEVASAMLFETRIIQEDGSFILLENSNEVMTNTGNNYIKGEDELIGTEPGGVIPTLQFPQHPTPAANIDATTQFLKQVTLFLRESQTAFDESVNIPNSPNNATADGNQHGRTKQTPDIMIILQTFETWLENLTANTTVKHQIEIYKQVATVARSVQNVVTLLLPTITSTDDLTAVSTSKLHLIASLGLEDAHLHESYGSAKLGPTGHSLDRFKFLFPPYSAGTRKIDRGGRIYRGTYNSSVLTSNYSGSNTSNDTYWDNFANTQIAHLNELMSVEDLVNFPGRKLDFTFDSEIFLRSS